MKHSVYTNSNWKRKQKRILEEGRDERKPSHPCQQKGKNTCWVFPSWSLKLLKETSTWSRLVGIQGLKGCSTAWERILRGLGGCKTYNFPHQGNVYYYNSTNFSSFCNSATVDILFRCYFSEYMKAVLHVAGSSDCYRCHWLSDRHVTITIFKNISQRRGFQWLNVFLCITDICTCW